MPVTMSTGYAINKKTAGPWVDIDLDALCANYAMIKRAAPKAEAAAVVKCDAYGLGMTETALALSKREQCRSFFVAYPEEGVRLRSTLNEISAAAKIYVFNGPLPQTMSLFAEADLIPVLNSVEQAAKWAERMPQAPAALHVDTGMNRLGAPVEDVAEIKAINGLDVDLVMSHLACGSEPTNPKNLEQLSLFTSVAAEFPGARKSLSASAGALMDVAYHGDLVRPGIALYGGSPFEDDDARICPVAALRCPVVQIREIKTGESVGYSASFVAYRPTRLATVALGYGDGFSRAAAGVGVAAIGREIVKIAGRISMDLISLDITDTKTPIKTGDIATFFGEHVTLFAAAKSCNTIPYEMLTGLGGRVDRRYV